MTQENTLSGVVTDILFQNNDNGYVVCEVALENEDVVMVGTIPYLMVGEGISATGFYVNHSTYGRQFKVVSCARSLPTGENAIREFLASGAIRGIGEVLAGRIVDVFGANTLDVIAESPEKLSEIQGITKKKAVQIGELFNYRMGIKKVIEKFVELGLTPDCAVRVYAIYGNDTLAQLHLNPYLVCQSGLDVDFATADRIASDTGFDMFDSRRAEAAIIHILTHNLQNGHTFLPRSKLIPVAFDLLGDLTKRSLTPYSIKCLKMATS